MSLGGLPVDLLTLTDYEDLSIPILQRKAIIVIARIRPGETPSSWVCQVCNFFFFS